jgi:hypothetical protein
MDIYQGFVYLWFDRKHKRYYIGSHIGNPDDGYICSSKWMNNAYKIRPSDFKRRILFQSDTITKKELHIQEQKWLDLIKPEELSKKYYNLKRTARGGAEKGRKCKGHSLTPEHIEKLRIAASRPKTPEHIEKMRLAKTGKKLGPLSPERRALLDIARQKSHTPEKFLAISKSLTGRKLSEEQKAKISAGVRKVAVQISQKLTGRTQPEDQKRKHSDNMKAYWTNNPPSEDFRRKLSENKKKWWAERKASQLMAFVP